MNFGMKPLTVVFVSLFVVLALLLPGCVQVTPEPTPVQSPTPTLPSTVPPEPSTTSTPSPTSPPSIAPPLTPPLEKGNPKLDSHLNQLIWAESQGEGNGSTFYFIIPV